MWSTVVGCCVIILLTLILLMFKRKRRHHSDDVVTATGEFEPCTGPWTRDPTKIAKVTMATSQDHRLEACGETERCPTVPNVKVTPTLLPEHFYEDDVTVEDDGYFRSVTSSSSKSSSFGDVIANGSLLGDVTIPKSSDDDEVMNSDDVTNAESFDGDVTEGLLTDEKRTLSHYDI